MNKVLGKVLVKESGVGIPDLVVAVFDADPSTSATSPAGAVGGLLGAASGDRIGSVLTDAEGRFELGFDLAAFAAGDPERRPDLVLAVFAPEDSRSDAAPTPLPPAERVLHVTVFARNNAGSTESFVIRLLTSQLLRAQIPCPRPYGGLSDPALLQSLDASFLRTEAVSGRLRARAISRLALQREGNKRAAAAFSTFTLSRLPAALRDDASYYLPGKDLDAARQVLVRRARERLARTPHRLHLGDADRDWTPLGARLDEVGARWLDVNAMVDWLPPRLTRAQTAVAPCDPAGAASRLVDAVNAPPPPGVDGQTPPPAEPWPAPTAESYVADYFAAEAAAGGAAAEPRSQRATSDDVTRQVGELELRGGPADVPAFHDFHDLRIAFEHIYAQLEDQDVRQWGESLYGLVIQRYGDIDGLPDRVTGTDELQALLETIRRLSEDAPIFDPPPPDVVAMLPTVATAWGRLDPEVQAELAEMAAQWADAVRPRTQVQFGAGLGQGDAQAEARARSAADYRAGAQAVLDAAVAALPPAAGAGQQGLSRIQALLVDLAQRLGEPYQFDVYVPGNCNYGALVTYRQEWTPLNYQVGELVATIPLAPKESRRFSKRTLVKKARSQKEIENAQWLRKQDADTTRRAEAEIVDRAVNNSNFKANAAGSGTIGVLSLEASTGVEQGAERASTDTKRNFREQVLRAAEEYRRERRLEVEFSSSEETEITSAGEIGNPNEELAVTYLFYQLQRRYEVRERIHELTPVVLVANEVPAPHHIDEGWLIRHSWVLRRVLLDDTFAPALDTLTGLPSAAFALEILRGNLERQKRIVDDLRQQVVLKTRQASGTFEDLISALAKQEGARRREASEGVFESVGEALFGGGGRDDSDGARLRAERARMAVDQVAADRQELMARLGSETSALEAAVERYTQALQEHLTRKSDIARLRLHVKDNIMYYMQSIWNHEPHDQRLLRLNRIRTFWISASEDAEVRVDDNGDVHLDLPEDLRLELDRPLPEVARLDQLLGYFGNYMVFPLVRNNLISAFMMSEYVDRALGLLDPDEFAQFTTEELLDHIRCLARQQPDGLSEEELSHWKGVIEARLTNPRREKDVVVVPTGSLYIEALPAQRSILEDFKLAHRALDVEKVRAEVRQAEIENLRRAARLLAGEREDPDVDRRVIVSGSGEGVIVGADG